MKKILDKLEDALPSVWAFMWAVAITFFSIGVAAWAITWGLRMMGVL